jgi:hypothetical protein
LAKAPYVSSDRLPPIHLRIGRRMDNSL